MGSEYEYYGNYSKIPSKDTLVSEDSDRKLKLVAVFGLFIPCIILLGINTYLLYTTQMDYKYLLEDYEHLYRTTRGLSEDVRNEIKPRIDFVTHFLSYKLPSAVLNSFKKSNKELTDSLSGITVNLDNLLELYRSILGFDDDWKLTPDTQHMTCSFIPNDQVSKMYERAFAAKERYAMNPKHPKSHHPLTDRLNYESGDAGLQIEEIEEIAAALNGSAPSKDEATGLLDKILAILGVTNGTTRFYNQVNSMRSKYFERRNDTTDAIREEEFIPTPTPDSRYLTPTHKPASKARKRRYAAHYGYAIDRSSKVGEFLKGVRVKIHTITDTVNDLCIATRSMLGVKNGTCANMNELIKLIQCLTGE